MHTILPEKLKILAKNCPKTLFVVGGFVRDFLGNLHCQHTDIDICGSMLAEEFAAYAVDSGLTVQAVYKNTGAVKLSDGNGNDFEYTCFRSDKYVRGEHTPAEIYFTEDIRLDARRRDFTVNAIYYNIKEKRFVDPLNGLDAIKEKRLTTVDKAQKVFGEDGLRLMRLARFSAQLGYSPDEECLLGAKTNAAMIEDISPERIYAELTQILHADEKYGVQEGHYQGLLTLEKIGVLEKIIPELTAGKGIAQRADFHKYDMLFHSLRTVKYAAPEVRLAALLHDVGKPFCHLRDGNSHEHPKEGASIAVNVLSRLKAPKKVIENVRDLTLWHMYDFNCMVKENKLRKFFVDHCDLLDELLLLKQADFSGCMDSNETAPTVVRWQELLERMKKEGAPLRLKELAIKGSDLIEHVPAPLISNVLKELLYHTVCFPCDNKKDRLMRLLPAALQAAKQKISK